jgi:hypothetical protein
MDIASQPGDRRASDVEYAFVTRDQDWHVNVVAKDLVERVFKNRVGVEQVEVVKT